MNPCIVIMEVFVVVVLLLLLLLLLLIFLRGGGIHLELNVFHVVSLGGGNLHLWRALIDLRLFNHLPM